MLFKRCANKTIWRYDLGATACWIRVLIKGRCCMILYLRYEIWPFMPQSHPTTGPTWFCIRMIYCWWGLMKRPWEFYAGAIVVVTSGYEPRTVWHDCTLMVWPNNSQDSTWTLCDANTGIVRAPHGNIHCFHTLGDLYGFHGRPGRVLYGHLRELTQPLFAKIPHGRRLWPHRGPVRGPHRPFTGCLWPLNPYRACKLITQALKLYMPRKGRKNSYGAARVRMGRVSGRRISVQNGPGTIRKPPIWGVMWLGH